MSSKYESIFDDDGVPFWDGPRLLKASIKYDETDIVIDGDGNPRYMGTPDQIIDWFYDIGQSLEPRPFKVLVRRIELDRYLSLDEYFDYFEFPLSLSMSLMSQ